MKKFKVKVEFDECKGCGRCVLACPKKVLQMGKHLNKLGYNAVEAVKDECIGCGSCYYQCPEPGALTIIELVNTEEK